MANKTSDLSLRIALADTYTFVKSTEINKTINNFTFDHYIDAAKREIKEDRILRSASNPNDGIGKRPAKLAALQKVQQDFNNNLPALQAAAEQKDSSSNST